MRTINGEIEMRLKVVATRACREISEWNTIRAASIQNETQSAIEWPARGGENNSDSISDGGGCVLVWYNDHSTNGYYSISCDVRCSLDAARRVRGWHAS